MGWGTSPFVIAGWDLSPRVRKIYRFTIIHPSVFSPKYVSTLQPWQDLSIYPFKWKETWFSLLADQMQFLPGTTDGRTGSSCIAGRMCLQMQQHSGFIQCELWLTRNITTRRKILLGSQILTPCWASSWRSESGIVVQKLMLEITFLYPDFNLKTLMKCEGDIPKNNCFEVIWEVLDVQKNWKLHCWLCLSMHASVVTYKVFLRHSFARTMWTKEPGRRTAIQKGQQWNPGLLIKRYWHSWRVKSDSEWLYRK